MNVNELGAICICMDEYNNGEMKGRIYSALSEEPIDFASAISLVKKINNIFDEGDYPQATMRCRGFGRKPVQTASGEQDNNQVQDPTKSNVLRSNIRGRSATFRVQVRFRQNASWQGSLFWVEKSKEESFRSVLELLMLIDSAFESEAAAVENDKMTGSDNK